MFSSGCVYLGQLISSMPCTVADRWDEVEDEQTFDAKKKIVRSMSTYRKKIVSKCKYKSFKNVSHQTGPAEYLFTGTAMFCGTDINLWNFVTVPSRFCNNVTSFLDVQRPAFILSRKSNDHRIESVSCAVALAVQRRRPVLGAPAQALPPR